MAAQRAGRRKIVLLARDGKLANDKRTAPFLDLEEGGEASEVLSIVDHELAVHLVRYMGVIAQGAVGTQTKQVNSGLFNVPRMALDFAKILPKVDLIVHHGEFPIAK